MLGGGTIIPEFSLPDQNGVIHNSKELLGKKTIIYFYPKDNTSGCSKQAEAYSAHIGEFDEKGIRIIGISKDSVSSHKKFEENHNIKFTLLSDTEKSAISAFDVWHEKKCGNKVTMGVIRTTYLIDVTGKIIFASDKVKAAEDAEKMLSVIE